MVGNVGLPGAIAIVVIANGVTLATALSVAAIATNMRVGAGGAYYIISRSLGVEIGAAIGIPLFLAQAFSVTLYAFGLAESLQLIWPDLPQRPVGALTVLVVALLAARGADLALNLQLPIMGGIALSLVVLVVAVVGNVPDSVLLTAAPGGEPFWPVFAVFFPAVTGIMAGISLSGDLRRPERDPLRHHRRGTHRVRRVPGGDHRPGAGGDAPGARRRQPDLRRGALMALVRSTVLQLRRLPHDPRNWRPNILLFAGDVTRRPNLVRFAAWLVQDRGILTVADLRVGALVEPGPSVARWKGELNAELEELGVAAFWRWPRRTGSPASSRTPSCSAGAARKPAGPSAFASSSSLRRWGSAR